MPGKGAGRPITNDFIEWNGRRHTWTSKGYWRCTSMHDRYYLTHKIWETHHGRPVPRGHQIVFADGNKWNIAVENLLCLSRREGQLRRMADPDYAMIARAYLAYGVLVQGMQEAVEPHRRRERIGKLGATRRARGNYGEAMQKAWKTRVERYGRKGHSGEKAYDHDVTRRREAAAKTWETRRAKYGDKGHA